MKPRYYFGDLSGPEGNALVVLGCAQRVLKGVYLQEEVEEFMTDAMSGDYRHLLETVDKHIGATVLYVPEDDPDDVTIVPLQVWIEARL